MEDNTVKQDEVKNEKEKSFEQKAEDTNKKNKHKKISHEKDELLKANLELKEKVLRISAEMQNMRKRYDLDMANFYKYEGFELIEKLLPVIDNFERAMAIKIEGADKYLSGFKMIYENLLDILKAKGVVEIEVVNKEFDTNIMHAVMTEKHDDIDNNIVLECMQKGYMYNDRLIRPAMVKVNEKENN